MLFSEFDYPEHNNNSWNLKLSTYNNYYNDSFFIKYFAKNLDHFLFVWKNVRTTHSLYQA